MSPLASLFGVAALGILLSQPVLAQAIAKPNIEVPSQDGTLVLKDLQLDPAGVGHLTGTITNNTSHNWDAVALAVAFYDKQGRTIRGPMPGGLPNFLVIHLQKGETKNFNEIVLIPRETVFDFGVTQMINHSYLGMSYVFSLIKPIGSKGLGYSDIGLSVLFEAPRHEISFVVQNNTDAPLALLWDEASFIDYSGTAHKVIHKGTRLIDREKPQTPTTIPPTAKVEELVYPADYVRYSEALHDWQQPAVIPRDTTKGQTFSLFLPIEVNGVKKNYLFTFRIDDVQS